MDAHGIHRQIPHSVAPITTSIESFWVHHARSETGFDAASEWLSCSPTAQSEAAHCPRLHGLAMQRRDTGSLHVTAVFVQGNWDSSSHALGSVCVLQAQWEEVWRSKAAIAKKKAEGGFSGNRGGKRRQSGGGGGGKRHRS